MNDVNVSAYERLNASFGEFVKNSAVKGGTIAKIDPVLKGVTTLKAGSGDFKGNLFRDAAQIAANNSIRDVFKNAVAEVFGGESSVPSSVKAAMKWDDFDGTGRPLTARRIRATMTAISAYSINGLDQLTHGKYNLGQLTLDAEGRFSVVNNHHILHNTASTTPEENLAVREKAFRVLMDTFVGPETGPKALAMKHLINGLVDGAELNKPLVRADVGHLIDRLKTLKSGKDGTLDSVLDIMQCFENAANKLVFLGGEFTKAEDFKFSSLPLSPKENRTTRLFLFNLIGGQEKSADDADGKGNPAIAAAKLILAKNPTSGITHDEAVELLRNVKQSLPNSPLMRQACERIKNKQGEFRAGFIADLKKLSDGYDEDLSLRNQNQDIKSRSRIPGEAVLGMLVKLSPRVLELKQSGEDLLTTIKDWAKLRQLQSDDPNNPEKKDLLAKKEKELENLGVDVSILKQAFKVYRPTPENPITNDPVSIDRIIGFWNDALEDAPALLKLELIHEDAETLGMRNAQQKLADKLTQKFMPGVSSEEIDASYRKNHAVLKDFAEVHDLKMQIEENDVKINNLASEIKTLQQELESRPSQGAENPKYDTLNEALGHFQKLYQEAIENGNKFPDWDVAKNEYAGENSVIRDMLARFADEDEDSVDDSDDLLIRRELDALREQIDELKAPDTPLKQKIDTLQTKLNAQNEEGEKLKNNLEIHVAQLEKKGYQENDDCNDLKRVSTSQKEYLAAHDESLRYQKKYGQLLEPENVAAEAAQ